MKISSPSFGHGDIIPRAHTIDGTNRSPPLAWEDVPARAKSLALVVEDPDAPDPAAPQRIFAHWIVYNLNPADNEVFATVVGNFQDGSSPGKMQYGSAWWFLDQLDGMEKQMNALSNMGLLSRFVGMLTDSRSFLSYSRHEYFRRLLR